MEQKNKNIREVLLDMLNEMSSAVNSFWNFQVVEQQDKAGNIILSVVDENWIGKKVGGSESFYHSGPNSIFLDASIDIALPSEMTNQIISRRLALANNPDEPIVGVGGFFESQTDLFLTSYTDSNGNARKILTQAEKDEQDKRDKEAADKAAADAKILPSQKTQDAIDISKGKEQTLRNDITTIRAKYAEEDGARQAFVEGLQTAINAITDLFRSAEAKKQAAKAEAERDLAETKRDADIAAVEAKIATEKAAQEILTKQKAAELKTEADVDGEIASKAIGANLEKIDVVPRVIKDKLDKIGEIQSPDVLKQNFMIFCMDDEPLFDRLKNDAFANKNGGTTAKGLSHPLPIKYTFKVLGTSGFRRGDTFNIIGIPTKYQRHGLFQITEIEHNVGGMTWTTSVTGQYRQMQ
jgi:hypothetical protein